MKQTKYRYFCFGCSRQYLSTDQPILKFNNEFGAWDGIKCHYCGGQAKNVGYKLEVTMSHAKADVQGLRREHRSAIRQPWREGQIDKVYLETYPDKKEAMIKEGVITREQANNAKDVWGNDDIR